jgi:hypothetical protein
MRFEKRTYQPGASLCEGTCGRFLRPNNAKPEDYPGTVNRHAKGCCKACYRKLPSAPPRHRLPTIHPCANCGHLTRPVRTSLLQHPGTVQRVGDLCRHCDSAGGVVDDDRARYVAGELEAFNQGRRKRGVPPEGIRLKEAS